MAVVTVAVTMGICSGDVVGKDRRLGLNTTQLVQHMHNCQQQMNDEWMADWGFNVCDASCLLPSSRGASDFSVEQLNDLKDTGTVTI